MEDQAANPTFRSNATQPSVAVDPTFVNLFQEPTTMSVSLHHRSVLEVSALRRMWENHAHSTPFAAADWPAKKARALCRADATCVGARRDKRAVAVRTVVAAFPSRQSRT